MAYTVGKEILLAPWQAFAKNAVFAATGVTADGEGKKIIKAGTPMYASGNVVTGAIDSTTPLTITGTTLVGLARHDVDVTNGNANDAIIIRGTVDTLKIDATTRAKITADVISGLPQITFVAGRED